MATMETGPSAMAAMDEGTLLWLLWKKVPFYVYRYLAMYKGTLLSLLLLLAKAYKLSDLQDQHTTVSIHATIEIFLAAIIGAN